MACGGGWRLRRRSWGRCRWPCSVGAARRRLPEPKSEPATQKPAAAIPLAQAGPASPAPQDEEPAPPKRSGPPPQALAGQPNIEPQPEKPAAGAKDAKPAANPFAVPNGTPEELLKYVEGLKLLRPASDRPEAEMELLKKQCGALLGASGKILAGKPNDVQAKMALQYKIDALELLDHFGDADAGRQIEALPEALLKAGFPALVREAGIAARLGHRLRRTKPADKDAMAKLIADVRACLGDGPPDQEAAQLALQTAMTLEHGGAVPLAAKTYAEMAKLDRAPSGPSNSWPWPCTARVAASDCSASRWCSKALRWTASGWIGRNTRARLCWWTSSPPGVAHAVRRCPISKRTTAPITPAASRCSASASTATARRWRTICTSKNLRGRCSGTRAKTPARTNRWPPTTASFRSRRRFSGAGRQGRFAGNSRRTARPRIGETLGPGGEEQIARAALARAV